MNSCGRRGVEWHASPRPWHLTIFLAYRHGLRAAEEIELRWEQFDLGTATQQVRRAKNGTVLDWPGHA